MGKHKNRTQSEIFIEFMEKNSDIAKGFSRREKAIVDYLWQQLTESLNSAGPPNKDVNGWKKIWTDWKSEVKKKLIKHNSKERVNGRGWFAKINLNEMEEAIVRICGIAWSVEGVSSVAIDLDEDEAINCVDEVPTTSKRKQRSDSAEVSNTRKKPRVESSSDCLKIALEANNEWKKEMSSKMSEIIKVQNENAISLRRVCRAIEKGNESVAKAITELKDEFLSFGSYVLQTMQEKTDIKREVRSPSS